MSFTKKPFKKFWIQIWIGSELEAFLPKKFVRAS